MNTFQYGADRLTSGIALKLARGQLKGQLVQKTVEKINNCRKIVERIAAGDAAVYGINTGFGPLCSTQISKDQTVNLQYNLLKSHSVGVGNPIPKEIAKLMLILKVHALAQGFSGIALTTMERILWHIKEDVIPVVPEQGSVGASGDLAPLSHLFLPLIGHGEVWYQGERCAALPILNRLNKLPIQLGAKEGLALINGTQFIAAHAVKVVESMHNCLSNADLIGAMMIEGLLGSNKPFFPDSHLLRPFPANQHVAQRIHYLLQNSEVVASHHNCTRVQDPYSLRCIPQVHGASRSAWLHLKEAVEIELNAVTDNPIIINEHLNISGGNFHGQPLALPLDYAGLAAAEVGNISDRRSYFSLTGAANGVPKLLMQNTGINSGFMIVQYTAAALVSENKSLCFPASADSVPTSLGQEDHVSMGSISGRKTLQIIENLEKILGVELLCATQAIDFHRPLRSNILIEKMHDLVRSKIEFAEEDRIFGKDILQAVEIVKGGQLLKLVEQTVHEQKVDFETNWENIFEKF
ncbi:MAG: histidine ammonia-lyase [Saprospiraceae bacterium]